MAYLACITITIHEAVVQNAFIITGSSLRSMMLDQVIRTLRTPISSWRRKAAILVNQTDLRMAGGI